MHIRYNTMIGLDIIHHVLFISMFGWNYLFEYLYSIFLNHPTNVRELTNEQYRTRRQESLSLAQNAKNAVHSTLFIIAYTIFDSSMSPYMALSSAMFYALDTYVLMKYMTHYTTEQLVPYICHHLISIAGLYYCVIGYHTRFLMHIYYILDCSNIFLYLTFHCIKMYPILARRSIMNLLILIVELVGYSYYRLYVFTTHLVVNRNIVYRGTIIDIALLTILYIMGAVWSSRLARQVIRKSPIIYSRILRLG